MIISLDDAKVIDPNITQDDLNGFETAVRALTNNKFQNRFVKFDGFTVTGGNTLSFTNSTLGLRVGDTIEIIDSKINDGLYVVNELSDTSLTVTGDLFNGEYKDASVVKIEYPADIVSGIKRLIDYDVKMTGKTGVKSETISRMSVTYYDATASENINGYPAAYMSFLDKYRKLRWS